MTTAYTLATIEDDAGDRLPAEILWTPTADDAVKNGFINHLGLLLTGVGEEEEPPAEFVTLGHHHTWTAICQAATAYMQATWAVPDLYTDPITKARIPEDMRTPLPRERWAVFIRHPHPRHPCGCEWDGTWRLVQVQAGEHGAVAVTVMGNPAVVTW
jgi:hypothetical protein